MPRRAEVACGCALLLVLAGASSCAGPQPETVEIGHHRVRLVTPNGWERLDHGRQQLFRFGEAQVSLVDLGPGTREAMVKELRAAQSLWRRGRRQDAFQRVRDLRSPALRFAPSQRRAEFWKPWTDTTYRGDTADSAVIGAAFEGLIAGVGSFPEVTPDDLLGYVLLLTNDRSRREVARRERRSIHGAEWVDVEMWDQVSHMNRSRVAFLENDGYLLALATDHGVYEQTRVGLEAVLASIEAVAQAPSPR